MTYQSKLARAREIINEHNRNCTANEKVGSSQTLPLVQIEEFEKKLVELGASTETSLSQATWEDLMECGLPKLLARQIAAEFRSKDESNDTRLLSAKKVNRMTFEQLFCHYDPDPVKGSLEVTTRLLEISKAKRCVVFVDGKVHVATSTRLLEEICRGYPEVSTISVDARPVQVYKIGERPLVEVDQNPIYHGRPLRTGEMCDQTHRSWSGVPVEVRQLVYLALRETGEMKVMSVSDAHNILDLCVKSVTGNETIEGNIRARVPRASVLLDELSRKGEAPRLKLTPGNSSSNDPFYS